MCGIAGFSWEDKALVKRMADSLEHRGPDDHGYYVDKNVSLGHRRLSIIDLKTGHQPVYNEKKDVCVIYNGEIYNYKELREELKKKKHRFSTNSDTEVIVHAYEEYGEAFVKKLRGIFALALWDAKKKKLLLARDESGVEPLYYAQTTKGLIFGSEIKAILESKTITPQMDKQGLECYLSYGSVLGEKTLFKGISKLPPGYILVRQNNKDVIKRYWRLTMCPGQKTGKYYEKRLRSLLEESVEMQLISDVPLGAFLSGGVDSSVIVGLMSRKTDIPIKTFTIGFGEDDDEVEYANIIAEEFATDHHERYVKYDEIPKILPKLVWHFDDLTGDSAAFPTYLVSQLARKHVKVVLTGEGSDEMFAGYNRYKPMSPGIPLVPGFVSRRVFSKHIRVFGGFKEPQGQYLEPYYRFDAGKLNQVLMFGFEQILPHQLLNKTNKATMACSLEARVPFLDKEIMDFSGTIPEQQKMNRFQGKLVLKRATRDIIPKPILNRKKHGFSPPMITWFKEGLGDYAQDIFFSKETQSRDYFDFKSFCEKYPKNNEFKDKRLAARFWHLLLLEVWYRRFIS